MLRHLFHTSVFAAGFLLCSFTGARDTRTPVRLPVLAKDYPITPVPFSHVHLKDQFWKPRIDKMFTVTIPHELDELRSTRRDKNFQLAALALETKKDTGSFCTKYPFDDTDLYKVIQGISYLLEIHPDKGLKASMDSLINLIAAAQEPDGYLYTARTINPYRTPEWSGLARWVNVEKLSHELYCSGHLLQAAAANYEATGDRRLLRVAEKNADLLTRTFGWGKLEKYPGHPEIALGLVSLYRVTGERKYLDLAKFFLDVRGPGGNSYEQAQQKVVDQRKAVGHAVRAGYLYSAMADVSALTGDEAYVNADNYIWKDIAASQIYVTGGIGSTSNGEAFGAEYQLPNLTAYNETCASIANVYFNERMFLTHGDGVYYDVLERTLYNALLSGISLSGDKFFYTNPLQSDGKYARSPWFGCSCCPTNLARFLPTIGGYLYATSGPELYVNLYAASEASIRLVNPGKDSGTVHISQQTDYPRTGKITLRIGVSAPRAFTLKLRIPGWAVNRPIPGGLYTFVEKPSDSFSVRLNGKLIHAAPEDGYVDLTRTWRDGDRLELDLPMDVRAVVADSRVKADSAKVALQRGPLVYCLEGPDNPGENVLNLRVDPRQQFTTSFKPDLLSGITVIGGQAVEASHTAAAGTDHASRRFTAIPYYTWANRGNHDMTVWISRQGSAHRALPAPATAAADEAWASRSRN